MAYKILYIEDNDPSSIRDDLIQQGFDVIHEDPSDFESSLAAAKDPQIDLILLDFRLSAKTAVFDAPTLAQTIRTIHSDDYRDIPIVLISSEANISGYYKDYTSQDLFDFAISKKLLNDNMVKYAKRIKDLIDGYEVLKDTISHNQSLEELLEIPREINEKFSPKVKDYLTKDKYKHNSFMASNFIINHIVKPAGLLIGKEIVAARLGVGMSSDVWGDLEKNLEPFKYTGIYSTSYERWWSVGIELWWNNEIGGTTSLKRLKAAERVEKLKTTLGLMSLQPACRGEHARSDYFWTICTQKKTPLDPLDGYEKDEDKEPWEDSAYYSLLGVSELESTKTLKMLDRKRYAEDAEGI